MPEKKILVVDDDSAHRMMLTAVLSDEGYTIAEADDGTLAVEAIREEFFDLILMDVRMTEMDGLEATRHLRTNDELNTVPVVALTALAMPGDRERCLAAGANEYLSKPVNLKRLFEVIEIQLQQVDGRNQAAELISPSK